MNQVIFGSKQLHLGTVRLTTGLLSRFGITPARYDMLLAITNAGEVGGAAKGIAQRDLRAVLGVTSPTISRMLKSLELLGFVKRTPHPRNPRHRWVTITAAALFRLRAAIADVVEGGDLAWLTEEFMNPTPGNHRAGDVAVAEAIVMMNRACVHLDHFATLTYPYDLPRCA